MSLSAALSSATAGIRLIQTDISVVSENISGVNDPNRTRQTVERTTDITGRVVLAAYTRQTNNALSNQVNEAIADASAAGTRQSYLKRINDLLGTTSDRTFLVNAMQEFTNAWNTLSATPESDVAKGEIVRLGDAFARELRRTANGVEEIQAQLQDDIADQVSQLNSLLRQVDETNVQIVAQKSNDQPTGSAEDKRDALVREISKLVDVRQVRREDGRIALFSPSGSVLLDAIPVSYTYANGVLTSNVGSEASLSTFASGSLGSLLQLAKDGSLTDPPTPVDTTSSHEVIRKLRSQLDMIADSFLDRTAPGAPTSFADAYTFTGTAAEGELDQNFFTGKDRFNFALNFKLLDGSARVKESAVTATSGALTIPGRTFTADGLIVSDGAYGDMISSFVSRWSLTKSQVDQEAKAAADVRDQLQQRYQSEVGVNLDDEIVRLQVLQRNYAASAQVITATRDMLDSLERIFR